MMPHEDDTGRMDDPLRRGNVAGYAVIAVGIALCVAVAWAIGRWM